MSNGAWHWKEISELRIISAQIQIVHGLQISIPKEGQVIQLLLIAKGLLSVSTVSPFHSSEVIACFQELKSRSLTAILV